MTSSHSLQATSPVRPEEIESVVNLRVAYIGARLPILSETFVYQELLAVRATGISVIPVSVYGPESDSRDPIRQKLASEAIVAYSIGGVVESLAEMILRPLTSIRTLTIAFADMFMGRESPLKSRIRYLPQAISSLGLARRLRNRSVTHIHAHMANTPATIAMFTAAQLRISFSFTGHANDLFVHRTLLREKLARAAFVACISRWHRDFYRRFEQLPDSRMPIIRCGVRVVNVPFKPVRIETVACPESPLQILSVGRLVSKKGMDTLINAIEVLGTHYPVLCRIVGDGPLMHELKLQIHSKGLQSRVVLMGPLANNEVLEILNKCDVFVLACRRDESTGDQDGIPVSLMEAMAAERCVITTNIAPITELVIDGETGICVPEADAVALAAAIRQLGDDLEMRTRIARQGHSYVLEEFERDTNALRLARLFINVTADSARRKQ